MKKARMHVISHTHWDREWYQDFQGYRRRLVHQTDALLELLARQPGFHSFLMDGQTAWVADYLEMRPGQRDRLAAHLRSGRIEMGPWFVMPDELLLSGESLVRNLALGHRICAEFGADALPVGYVTDIFGHCSQFPQILLGFGIDCAMLHRGTACADENSEMVWEGADGSEVLLVKVFAETGYNDFLSIRWGNWDDAKLREYEQAKLALATTPVLFALDGNDHEPAREDTLDLIERVNGAFERTKAVHSSFRDYLTELRTALGKDWQAGRRRFRGELRSTAKSGAWSELMTGTASSRVPLKQANDAQEWLLARGADPLHGWARLLGADGSQQAFLDLAWRNLLLNHPHDSIVGCSIDQVHRDMMHRFDQARLLGDLVVGESLGELADRINASGFGSESDVVTVVNLSSVDSGPVTRFSFECEAGAVARDEAAGLRVALFDETGNRVYFDILHREAPARSWPLTRKEPGWYRTRPYKEQVRFHVAAIFEVPAMGYQTLGVRFVQPPRGCGSNRVAPVTADAVGRRLENGLVSLRAQDDGSVTLRDKATGITYSGLHVFEDRGDIGDGWNQVHPQEDRTVLSSDDAVRGPVTVEVEKAGLLEASLIVRFTLRVPADAEAVPGHPDRLWRTRRTVRLDIRTRFTLLAGERRVECRTTVSNTARRHRLRVMFASRRACDHWYGDSAFDVVARPTALPDTEGWKEQAREETPVKNVVAAQDDRGALAVLTRGLQEACVRDDRSRTIALTLFRSFVQTLYFTPTRDSLLSGSVVGDYALVPMDPAGTALPAVLMREVDRYKAPLFNYTRPCLPGGDLPVRGQLIEVPTPLALSTVKNGEEDHTIVVRVFNPLDRSVTAMLRPGFRVEKACRTDLLENPETPLRISRTGIRVTLVPKQVLNLRLTFAKPPRHP